MVLQEYTGKLQRAAGLKLLNRFRRKACDDNKGVLVNCCCPGYAKTDMTSYNENATKNTEQGAQTSVWLALLPPGISGPQGIYLADA